MTRDKPIRWLRAPLQQRSEKTLQRILDATEEILESKSFPEITVSEIVRKARSSVGVFYARFPDKLALLHLLDDRFTAEAEETVRRELEERSWDGRTLEEVSRELIAFLCGIHRRKRGVLRSIILQVRANPDRHFQENGRRLTKVAERIADFLGRSRKESNHPRPEEAFRLALVMVMATIRETVLFSETTMWPELLGLNEEEFHAALTDSFLRLCGLSAR